MLRSITDVAYFPFSAFISNFPISFLAETQSRALTKRDMVLFSGTARGESPSLLGERPPWQVGEGSRPWRRAGKGSADHAGRGPIRKGRAGAAPALLKALEERPLTTQLSHTLDTGMADE